MTRPNVAENVRSYGIKHHLSTLKTRNKTFPYVTREPHREKAGLPAYRMRV